MELQTHITPAQLEVLRHKALGQTDSQVSKAMGISRVAVTRRRERAMFAVRAKNITHAVYLCGKAGLI